MGLVPTELGVTRQELVRLLGQPTDTSVSCFASGQPMIWKYGDIEYHFDESERVWLIYTEDKNGDPHVLGKLAGR